MFLYFYSDNKTVLYNPLFPSSRVQVYIYIYSDINHRKILCLVWLREGVVIRFFLLNNEMNGSCKTNPKVVCFCFLLSRYICTSIKYFSKCSLSEKIVLTL